MTEIAADWPLWDARTETVEQTLELLNDPQGGVALMQMPNELDPQGLIDSLVSIIQDRQLLDPERGFYYEGVASLMPKGIELDAEALDFDETYQRIKSALNVICGQLLRATSVGNNFGIINFLSGKTWSTFFTPHADSYFMTTWFGLSAGGLEIELPDAGWVPVERLPAGRALVTRQSLWPIEGCDDETGIKHKVYWNGKTDTDFRLVGIDHRHRLNDPAQRMGLKSSRPGRRFDH